MRRLRRRSLGRPSRAREWLEAKTFSGAGQENVATPIFLDENDAVAIWVVSPDDMQVRYDEPTLVRSILKWNISWVSAGGGKYAWMGLGLISYKGQADPPNVSDVPLPLSDADADWIWKADIYFQARLGLTVQWNTNIGDKNGFEDVKAKRKFHGGSGLLWVAETSSDTDPDSQLGVQWSGRFLVLN